MIIQINKNEQYQIELPTNEEVVDANTLIGLKTRLDEIIKMLIKYSNTSEPKITRSYKKRSYSIKNESFTRDIAIDLIKAYYSGNETIKQNFCAQYSLTLRTFKYYKVHFISKYKITPQEVGLKNFPQGATGPLTKELLDKLRL